MMKSGADPHSKSLRYPVDRGVLDPLPAQDRVVGFGLSDPQALAGHGGRATFVQGFRPHYLALAAAGADVHPKLAGEGEAFARAIIRLGRHRGQNERWLREAVAALRPGATVIAAGARTDGASSMRRRLAELIGDLGHAAMNHGEVFWFAVEDPQALLERLPVAPESLVEGRFSAAPGMFSHAHVDPGSRLLADHLPADLGGAVADFGAGWGYLAARIVEREAPPSIVDLYEADFDSLAAARANVKAPPGTALGFHWCDLTGEPVGRAYDSVVMNPPFHTGRAAEPDLGNAMIRAAAAALKPDGRLFLVANRRLRYEKTLGELFRTMRELRLADGYKVIEAAGPVRRASRAASVR